ncbi:scavenger receptor cysteine-rich domain-containing protein DMBT1-like [Crassostrea virginica]
MRQIIVILLGYFCSVFSGDVTMHAQSKQRIANCTEDQVDAYRGHINSPGYPGEYPNNVNLTRIISFGYQRASVNFTILDLDAESCCDYLKIEKVELVPCCNTSVLCQGCRNQSNSIIAEGRQFRVSFISDSSVTKRGFKLYWQAKTSVEREETHYTRQLGGESGEITSLGYPCNYSNNANYTWIIKTRNNRTSVNFTILDLQAETYGIWSCSDYLQIERIDPCCIRLTKGCRSLAYSIVSKGNRFRVSLISNSRVNERGFRIYWQAAAPISNEVDVKECINHQSSGRSGQMYSPGYPANYPNNINYTWNLVSGSNNIIVNFTIVDLQAESDSKLSCFDYLIIERVDIFPCCSLVYKGCRTYKNSVVAEGKQFRVSFITDNLVTRKGFKIDWQANASVQIIKRNYIEHIDGENGQITSLGYPCTYPNNVNYTWILKTGNNKTSVNFHILDVQAETRGDWSCFDYLKIDRIEPCCASLTEVCRNLTYNIAAEGVRFRVSFISDGSNTRKGFKLLWKVFSPWKSRQYPAITQSFDVTPRTTANEQKDTKTSEDNGRTENSSLYRLLFIVSSGFVATLLLVILCIVMYYKKKNQRKCPLPTSLCTPDSLGNENNTVYENVASHELPRRADNSNCQNNIAEEEMYTDLMF